MPVRQETNARFLVQVSIKIRTSVNPSENCYERKKKVVSEDSGIYIYM